MYFCIGLYTAHSDTEDPGPVPGHSELQERRTGQTGTLNWGHLGQAVEMFYFLK